MPTVSFSAGFTRNMGDFESLRIDIGVTDEPRGDELVSEAMNRVKDYVESELLGVVAAVEKDIIDVRTQIRTKGSYKRKVQSAAEKDEAENQPHPQDK